MAEIFDAMMAATMMSGGAAGDSYTKAEADAKFAQKQDALNSAQLAAVNSGITSVDVAQITTNKNNISKDEAALVEIVDSGAKNIIDINPPNGTDSTGITYTPNADKSFTAQGTATSLSQKRLLTVSAEEAPKFNGMVLSGCPSGGGNDTYRLVFMRDGSPYTTYAADYGNGTVIQNVPAVPCRVFLYIESGQTVDITFKPMICTEAAWKISQQYVPHRPSYDELIARVEALEGGV